MLYSGHVRKRNPKSGKLTYQVIVEEPPDSKTGKRQRKYYTVHGTKKEAEQFMRNIINDLENKTYVKPTNVTVRDWIEEFHETYQIPYLSPTTLRSYGYQINMYILPRFGRIPIQNLSTTEIQKWVNDLYKESPVSHKPMSAKSVKNIFLNLSACLEQAVKLDILKKNPCKNVTLPKKQQHEIEIYDEDEVAALVACLKGTEIETAIMLALNLGLRRGELIALRWANVDLENGIIYIKENRVDGMNGEVVTKSPKSQAGIRDISISAPMIEMLKKEKKKFDDKKAKYGIGNNGDDYVVCQKNGKPYKPFSFTKKFRTFLADNNLRHIRLHDLRHTNASLLLGQGANPKVVQKRLGHADFSTTMNIYSHVMKKMDAEAADKLDGVLFKNTV